jgi:hypothetical protein
MGQQSFAILFFVTGWVNDVIEQIFTTSDSIYKLDVIAISKDSHSQDRRAKFEPELKLDFRIKLEKITST